MSHVFAHPTRRFLPALTIAIAFLLTGMPRGRADSPKVVSGTADDSVAGGLDPFHRQVAQGQRA